jgi:hypothetical protein
VLVSFQSCGKDLAVIEQDSQRAKYLSPEEAVQYGLIDKVLYPEELRKEVIFSTHRVANLMSRFLTAIRCILIFRRPQSSWTFCKI